MPLELFVSYEERPVGRTKRNDRAVLSVAGLPPNHRYDSGYGGGWRDMWIAFASEEALRAAFKKLRAAGYRVKRAN
jgi:hypothetical protein